MNELVRYAPSEVLLNGAAAANGEIRTLLTKRMKCMCQTADFLGSDEANGYYQQHFGQSQSDTKPVITASASASTVFLAG